ADPVPIDQTDLFGELADPLTGRALAPGDMSPEYLARRLDEFSLWLREAASGRLVMGPTSVGTSIPSGPNEQIANLTPACIQASTWSSRTG
ncbi:site-specific integrase, partial [Pseudomonas syringae pv. actinidiae]|nr:site-specific integrase [Pseudomonas syringae pv. actinidiae]